MLRMMRKQPVASLLLTGLVCGGGSPNENVNKAKASRKKARRFNRVQVAYRWYSLRRDTSSGLFAHGGQYG
jgi:hypothetical protein